MLKSKRHEHVLRKQKTKQECCACLKLAMGCQHKSTLYSPAAHLTWKVAYSSHFSYMHWKENVSREPISAALSALRKLFFFFVKHVFITSSINKKWLQVKQLHFIFLSKYFYFTEVCQKQICFYRF